MDQPGVEVRPIIQMTGDSEFSEVFFSNARTPVENRVGPAGGGWAVAMGTLAFERGASTLGQQMLFQNELDEIIRIAQENGKASDPLIRQRIAQAWMGLRIQRYHALRTLSGSDAATDAPPAASISKIFWATWHRDLGKLAMDVMGPEAEIAQGEPYDLTALQRMFLFTRSDTIYAGSNEIQRNIISERVLGLPREPR
jgi:alkylation response protein AidB-like acyl-CoA dehydrogenase